MKPTLCVFVTFLFLELLAIATINIGFCHGSSYVGCFERERQALLRFKQDLTDPFNRLASWTGDGDCCTWAGVTCDNFTGHVLELNLRNYAFHYYAYDYIWSFGFGIDWGSPLGGKINPSLLDFSHLIHLDLSCNDFGGEIPRFIGSMGRLRYLNLSIAGFTGMIPHELGNLSNLQYFDLGQNNGFYVENFAWISGLSLLEYLDVSYANLSKVSDHWLQVINSLPSLAVLRLSSCSLDHIPSITNTNFSSLATLDLSNNYFDNSLIPGWIFALSHLTFLDLNSANFRGPLADGLQNLTTLRYLEYFDLGGNYLQGTIHLAALGNLTSIQVLDLSFNDDLRGSITRSWGGLCKLKSLSLTWVALSQQITEVLDILSKCVSNSLESLELSGCQLSGLLTNQLGQLKGLRTLDLSENFISGSIPLTIGELLSLTVLDFHDNQLNGPIPWSLGELSASLITLDLSKNKLNGVIPASILELSSLRILDLSINKLNGKLFEIHSANLTSLKYFSLSGNSLILEVKPIWIPPFQVEYLSLSSCHLGPQFPLWIQSQKNLSHLDISNSGILDTIPNTIWKAISNFEYLNLSHNQIYGQLPNLRSGAFSLDLSFNNLSGPLPLMSFNVDMLDLSNNLLSGSIFPFICYKMNESKNIEILKLARNFLSSDIPDCWMNWPNLLVLDLGNNNFTGSLPASMASLSSLQSLNLRNNRLSGVLPLSLKNCTQLIALDVGGNELVGNVPTWIGDSFPILAILNLRSNKFHGVLPTELCHLTSLQILDLADNNLSGTVPKCINNLTAMAIVNYSEDNAIYYLSKANDWVEDASLVVKGVEVEYNTILNLVRSVDISKNNFSGKIPMEVTKLGGLQSLNLSNNFFTGNIPENIGSMRSLESIDLSKNQLSGKIPHSITSLSFLSLSNFSHNNLVGEIPSSTQLQTFDASCFIGNDLCGSPLPKCKVTSPTPDIVSGGEKDGNRDEVDWFYVSMAPGFVVGFWIVIGPLLVSRRWKHLYGDFLDRLGDKFVGIVRKHF